MSTPGGTHHVERHATPAAEPVALPDPPGRPPPHNLDAERSLLGGILLDPASPTAIEALSNLSSSDFYRDTHRHVFEAMLSLVGDGTAIDRVAVKDAMEHRGTIEGASEDVDLLDKFVPTAANLSHYAKIIRDKATTRRLIEAGRTIAQLGHEQHGDALAFAADCARRVQAAAEEVFDDRAPSFVPADDFFASCAEHVEYILPPYLVRQGFTIVSGAPKHGKTWFLGWLAGSIAESGRTVFFVEEEGSPETLRERLRPFKPPGARIYVSHRNGWKLDDEQSVARLISEIKTASADVLILDPLNQLHAHLRKIGDVPAEVIQALQHIISETGCAIILAAHTRKGTTYDKTASDEAQSADIAGSYAWAASADNIIQIKACPNADRRAGEVRFFIENPDTRNGEPFAKRLAVVRPGPYRADAMLVDGAESEAARTLREHLHLVPTLPGHITVAEWREAAGIGMAKIRAAAAEGERTNQIGRKVGKQGGIYRIEDGGLSAIATEDGPSGPVRDPPFQEHFPNEE